ncbi:EutN/CcmL family microcompartment protein [Candidatus Poribacteria bacterium]|nr:EutN/CcmL family microcompartment protein [Candidatus Poribacteria bacterium]
MDIAKVIGTIVATRKDPSLVGYRLLVVQPLDAEGGSIGDPVTAVDIQGAAGYGELVYIVTGGDAVFVSAERTMPVDVAVVGIVDSITVTEEVEE